MMELDLSHDSIKKAIHRSQKCQRNWDLSKTIPQEDLDIIAEAATQCPSKQNISYYRVQFITNRDRIEQVYRLTEGAVKDPESRNTGAYPPNGKSYTNPQTLANLLIVYEAKTFEEINNGEHGPPRNKETYNKSQGIWDEDVRHSLERDRRIAIGISAGYVNLVSNLLGYATGFCQCVNDKEAMRELLCTRTSPALLMGVGFKNPELNRRIHHADHSVRFGKHKKQPVEILWVK